MSYQQRPSHTTNGGALPVYPCGLCRKEVNDDDEAILCESGCESWFHRVCTGMSKKAYDLLTAEISAEWVCDNCVRSRQIPMFKYKTVQLPV